MAWIIIHTLIILSYTLHSDDVDATKSRVESCISAICDWMDLNELKLNHEKTEVILIHSKYPCFQALRVGDESMAASQSARSLGVIFDEHMSFHAYVSSICRSSFTVHALVTSKLDYCNALLDGLPKY